MADNWELITPEMMTLRDYPCGVSRGDILTLRQDLNYRNHLDQPTGEIRHAGEEAMVMTGNPAEPDVIWIKWREGTTQTWDDDIMKSFERSGRVAE